MTAQTHGSPTRPPRLLEPGMLTLEVADAMERLRSEPAFLSDGRNSATIVADGPTRIIVTVVEGGRDVGADTSDGHLAILVLEGGGTLSRGPAETRIGAGSLAVLAPGSPWSLRADSPTAFVASFWQPA